MIITIKSGEPITEETIGKVKDIFRESNCPNESLLNSLDKFTYFRDKTIQLAEGENFTEYISVEAKDSTRVEWRQR